jgi:aryl-alcohol dehydrogenase-like predicted oxidoreductase
MEANTARAVGSQGLSAFPVGLGCLSYSPAGYRALERVIRYAADLGVTLFDTADVYGPFHGEEALGRALHGVRANVAITTKFGVVMKPDGTWVRIDGSATYMRAAVEASLRRLGTDYIDLYYLHRVDPKVPVEDSVGAMGELVAEGKIRYIGLTEVGPSTLRRAHSTFPVSAVQSEYCLWCREPEDGVLQTAKELGIGSIAYSPLGRGLLSGDIRSVDDLPEIDARRQRFPRFNPDNLAHNLKLVDSLASVAHAKGISIAQLALAWVLAQGDHIIPIPGADGVQQVRANAGAARVRLTDDDLAAIEAACPHSAVHGERKDSLAMQRMAAGLSE